MNRHMKSFSLIVAVLIVTLLLVEGARRVIHTGLTLTNSQVDTFNEIDQALSN